jgi:hypothetical protein
MMRKGILLLIGFCFLLNGYGQFTDDFSDGDFTQNPTWFGEVSKFQVNSNDELWLNAPALNDTAYLVTVSQTINNASWEFYVRLGFTPSTSNFARVYLVSDQPNLRGPLNGYFILIGQASSPTGSREISLFRQNGTTNSKILAGLPNQFNGLDPLEARVRVTRDGVGNWELFYDSLGGNNFISMGTAFDNTHTSTNFFGVRLRYTSTRSTAFWFDDFAVSGDPVLDLNPPVLLSASAPDVNTVRLRFNKPITTNTASNVSNFSVSGGIGNPAAAQVAPDDALAVILTLGSPLVQNQLYTVSISGLQDLSGNLMPPTSVDVAFFIPALGDVVLNEVFPDPNPPVGLPEFEFIELYNTSIFPIDLTGWTLQVGSSVRTLPPAFISPGQYLVLADPGAQGLFPPGVNAIYLSSWPALTNSASSVSITSTGGVLIDAMSYTANTYRDQSKSGGGWTLERISPLELCGGEQNWTASISPTGGTPGFENSVFQPILPAPQILEVFAATASEIIVFFNKSLDLADLSPDKFMISPGVGVPVAADLQGPNEVKLTLSGALQPESAYTLSIVGDLGDCAGNLIGNLSATFIYYIPQSFDVIINELMADETPVVGLPENEWIELHNRKPFPISLRGWTIQIGNTTRTLEGGVIEADSFIVLMRSTFVPNFPGIATLGMPTVSSLPNSSGTVTLRASNGRLMHSVSYTDRWYQNNAKRNGGWSLELIDPANPCGEGKNWRASENFLGGTPGRRNSIHGNNPDLTSPRMVRAGIIFPDTVIAYFDEALYPESVQGSDFFVDEQGLPGVSAALIEPALRRVKVALPFQMAEGETYSLRIQSAILDCSGNSALLDTVYFGVPQSPQPGDVLLNEVLSAATGSNVDFVELYNNSDKLIDLSRLRLGNFDTLTNSVLSPRDINDASLLFLPGEYLVLSTSQDTLRARYTTPGPRAFWDLSSFPSLAKETGTVAVSTNSLQVIDGLAYNRGFQFSLLRNIDNVSMERILHDAPTQDPQNWTSAAQIVGWATPGYRNSQFAKLAPMSGNFTLDPEIFSPDNDGYNDNLFIRYALPESGFLGTVHIYDAAGRRIKTIANNEFLAIEGFWVWDGVMDDGSKARAGLFVITFEIFAPDGRKDMFRKSVALANRL